ncbi:MAG: hypothetical protein A3C15_00645 [Candidatus Magasanikbacteria bacterium RIFCSPHIGHO2_02_FULL_50_9b]|uniref:Uncharacterized protein n=1 Tax=Candidatus Magasanikbacteria bacterium RIFCSPHIGHO2_02_FULL_50_9b TaxID=1798682 RepID=A0A1F6M8Z7_9BACT|nr:MAG: hypothetical protein A3C15_00645 [Candidatus Magasanikbacteria bacterium RIFCSPHIGHO2_02_FULL_50_9b]
MFGIIEIFCAWCRQKIALHVDERPAKFFKQGEVWWCRVGKNVGDEIYGKGEKFARPVLIFKKLTRTTFLALPITSLPKIGTWYVSFELSGIFRSVLLNQARTLDSHRLLGRIGTLTDDDAKKIRTSFLEFYAT